MIGIRLHTRFLRSDDVLFFLHIPKNAGLSIIEFLESLYPEHKIFPLHSDPNQDLFEAYSDEQLQNYRFVRGHFYFGPHDKGVNHYLVRNPIIITMLRDPITRTISHFRHNQRHEHGRWHKIVVSQHMSLSDFVTSPDTFDAVVNAQVRQIVGGLRGNPCSYNDPEAYSDETLLFLAKEKLEQYAWFGLQECFQESLLLLTHTFGWEQMKEIPKINVSPEPSGVDSITENEHALIVERTQLDSELYRFAKDLFLARFRQLAREIIGGNVFDLSLQEMYRFIIETAH